MQGAIDDRARGGAGQTAVWMKKSGIVTQHDAACICGQNTLIIPSIQQMEVFDFPGFCQIIAPCVGQECFHQNLDRKDAGNRHIKAFPCWRQFVPIVPSGLKRRLHYVRRPMRPRAGNGFQFRTAGHNHDKLCRRYRIGGPKSISAMGSAHQ